MRRVEVVRRAVNSLHARPYTPPLLGAAQVVRRIWAAALSPNPRGHITGCFEAPCSPGNWGPFPYRPFAQTSLCGSEAPSLASVRCHGYHDVMRMLNLQTAPQSGSHLRLVMTPRHVFRGPPWHVKHSLFGLVQPTSEGHPVFSQLFD